MRKWKLLLAGMMLMLSLSAVAGCGNNNANDKNNGTNGTNTSTENRLNNNADTTTGNDKNNIDTTEDKDKDNNRVDENGNVIEDVVDGVGDAGKDVIDHHGKHESVFLPFGIGPAPAAAELGACHLEPVQVIGIVNYLHLIRLTVAHPDLRGKGVSLCHLSFSSLFMRQARRAYTKYIWRGPGGTPRDRAPQPPRPAGRGHNRRLRLKERRVRR